MEPKERGGPISKFWDDAGVIKSLEIVKTWLMKNAKKVDCIILYFDQNYQLLNL